MFSKLIKMFLALKIKSMKMSKKKKDTQLSQKDLQFITPLKLHLSNEGLPVSETFHPHSVLVRCPVRLYIRIRLMIPTLLERDSLGMECSMHLGHIKS